MTFDLPNESCAGKRKEVLDKGYSTGYFSTGSAISGKNRLKAKVVEWVSLSRVRLGLHPDLLDPVPGLRSGPGHLPAFCLYGIGRSRSTVVLVQVQPNLSPLSPGASLFALRYWRPTDDVKTKKTTFARTNTAWNTNNRQAVSHPKTRLKEKLKLGLSSLLLFQFHINHSENQKIGVLGCWSELQEEVFWWLKTLSRTIARKQT
jgi:hypothetical protein